MRANGRMHSLRMAFRRCATIVIAGFSIAAGCSKNNPHGPQAAQSESPKRMAFAAIGFQEDQFFKLAQGGMKSAADKAGVELLTGSSAGSLDKEMTLVDTYTAQKVKAIVIAPLNTKSSIPALQRAHDAGIKIVTYDNALQADFPESTIKSDPILLGRPTGEAAKKYIETKLGGKAKIAVITYI